MLPKVCLSQNFSSLLVLPDRIRIDGGTETGVMATIRSYLHSKQGDLDDGTDCILYGTSTQNKIERWSHELFERMEKFFKDQLSSLAEGGHYNPSNETHR